MTRRQLLAALAPAARPRLIAHRGGIVDDAHPENSRASLLAAIARHYWMIEVDVRASKDGEPLLHHDPTLERFYGLRQRPEDLSWRELSRLRSTPGNEAPLHFDDLCQLCRGKTRLMLDIKNALLPPAFYERMAKAMSDSALLHTAYMLGGDRWRPFFGPGGVRESTNRATLTAAANRGEDTPSRYFLFELPADLTPESFQLTRRLNVDCVAAINTFRYTLARRDPWLAPEQDISRLLALGVPCFQIDSRYEPLLAP
ncbi:MAG: hypothetical protein K7J46_10930 [Bryobacter sp.]|jgi:hypothetical protein|nr:hypothetical protein [Bryobacter sp. CoA8 C33]